MTIGIGHNAAKPHYRVNTVVVTIAEAGGFVLIELCLLIVSVPLLPLLW